MGTWKEVHCLMAKYVACYRSNQHAALLDVELLVQKLGDSALIEALANNYPIWVFESLIQNGVNLDFQDIYGNTVLIRACMNKEKADIACLLVEYGANLNVYSSDTFFSNALSLTLPIVKTDFIPLMTKLSFVGSRTLPRTMLPRMRRM